MSEKELIYLLTYSWHINGGGSGFILQHFFCSFKWYIDCEIEFLTEFSQGSLWLDFGLNGQKNYPTKSYFI